MVRILRALVFSAALHAFAVAVPAYAGANVVATIKPVHSLIASIMLGIGEPYLIVRGAASPHTYSLRPSDAKALEAAQLVFWLGEDLENFLENSIDVLAANATVIKVLDIEGLTLLTFREGGSWTAHRHEEEEYEEHEEQENHGEHGHAQTDLHLWLDPHNAMSIVQTAATALSAADPDNALRYDANATAVLERLADLDLEMATSLSSVRHVPYIVFHDAYHYLEHRYGLSAVGSVTVNPDRQPGVERLRELREKIRTSGAACAFTEPQFRPAIVDTVVEGLDTRVGVLDPLGASIEDGPELYFTLMRNNTEALADCLSGSR